MMLLAKEFALSPPPGVAPRRRPSARVAARGGSPVPDLWLRTAAPATASASAADGFASSHSHDGDCDLAMLVTDFLENGAAGSGDSRNSSDSESGLSDLAHLADTISMLKQGGDEKENELLSLVHSLLLSIHELQLQPFKRDQCGGSCIRHLLVKLLRYSGNDAAVCTSKWQGFDKIPGGDYEYIDVIMHGDATGPDVIMHGDATGPERLIVDIDFRSHFEIARAVDSYCTLLNSLPVVYVGTLPRLKQFLHVMVDAAKWSLKQNSMPLPPWRSLPYLQAKWQSKYERKDSITEGGFHNTSSDHTLCIGHLKRLKTSLQLELETTGLLMMPIKADKKRMPKSSERRRRRSLLSC